MFKTYAFSVLHIWRGRKSSIKNKNAVNPLNILFRNYWRCINKFTLLVFSVSTGSNCWLQYRPIFSKPVKFYGVNIACLVLRMHKKLPGQLCTKDKHCAEQRRVINRVSSSVSTYCFTFKWDKHTCSLIKRGCLGLKHNSICGNLGMKVTFR